MRYHETVSVEEVARTEKLPVGTIWARIRAGEQRGVVRMPWGEIRVQLWGWLQNTDSMPPRLPY